MVQMGGSSVNGTNAGGDGPPLGVGWYRLPEERQAGDVGFLGVRRRGVEATGHHERETGRPLVARGGALVNEAQSAS